MTLILCFNFYLKVFCPLFIVMACRVFWDWPFCNLWQCTELLNSKSNALKHGSSAKYWLQLPGGPLLSSLFYGRQPPTPHMPAYHPIQCLFKLCTLLILQPPQQRMLKCFDRSTFNVFYNIIDYDGI